VDVLNGKIGMKEMQNLLQHEMEDCDFNIVRRALSNVVNVQPDLSLTELQGLIEMMSSPDPEPDFRWAILTGNPMQAAFSTLVQGDRYFSDIIGVFSTLDACCRFLGISFDESEFFNDDYSLVE